MKKWMASGTWKQVASLAFKDQSSFGDANTTQEDQCKYNTRRPYEKQWSHITIQEDAVTTQEEQGFFLMKEASQSQALHECHECHEWQCTCRVKANHTAQWGTQQRSMPAISPSPFSQPQSHMTAPWQPRQPHHTAAMLLLLNLSLPL